MNVFKIKKLILNIRNKSKAMKYFKEPKGKFVIKIPIEWQYKNLAAGYDEKPPFSFELYDNSIGCFQISCYSDSDKPLNKSIKPQDYNTDNLAYIEKRMDGDGFNIHLWYAIVEDHMFMIKYIYDTNKANSKEIISELEKAKIALKTLQLLSPERRILAYQIDKFEKFNASLAASFDLKNKALECQSFVEFVIIIANQIDAYLRISIVLKNQLQSKNDELDIKYLFQDEEDKPIMEKAIYNKAKELKIIDEKLYQKLYSLYGERNKLVHRYIISDFKTRYISNLAYQYEILCEDIRLILKDIEDTQFNLKIGIYGTSESLDEKLSKDDIRFYHSQVNDKHLTEKFRRKITESNNEYNL